VDLVGDGLHAVRELVRVGDKVALTVAVHQRPAVVDVDIFVAEISQSQADELGGGIDGSLSVTEFALANVLYSTEPR
jgi:hypothetical protein